MMLRRNFLGPQDRYDVAAKFFGTEAMHWEFDCSVSVFAI